MGNTEDLVGIMKYFIQSNTNVNSLETTQGVSIQTLEIQMGEFVQAISKRPQGTIPSDT